MPKKSPSLFFALVRHGLRKICFIVVALLLALASLLPAMVLSTEELQNPGDQSAHAVCAGCHYPGANPLADATLVEPPKKRPCIECHADILRFSDDGASPTQDASSVHTVGGPQAVRIAPLGGPSFSRLDCLSCHTPHSSAEPKFLRAGEQSSRMRSEGVILDPVTRHCLGCHPIAGVVKAFGRHYLRHPVGIPVNKPDRILDRTQLPPLMDVKGTPDPSDDVVGCTTCHIVHASKNKFLLRWGLAELSGACLKCHPEVRSSGSDAAVVSVRR